MLKIDKTNIRTGINPRQKNDYYATDPIAFNILNYHIKLNKNIWEPACGELYLSNRMEELGYNVKSTDIINYCGNEILNFLEYESFIDGNFEGDIITNPPFKFANEFVEKGMECLNKGNLLCLFLKIQFLECANRYELLKKYKPKKILVTSRRIIIAKDGDFENTKGSAMCFAWYIWEKGYEGDTTLEIVNGGDIDYA